MQRPCITLLAALDMFQHKLQQVKLACYAEAPADSLQLERVRPASTNFISAFDISLFFNSELRCAP